MEKMRMSTTIIVYTLIIFSHAVLEEIYMTNYEYMRLELISTRI